MACGLAKVHTVAHNLPVRCACLSMPTALPTALVQPATVDACSTRGSSPAAAEAGKAPQQKAHKLNGHKSIRNLWRWGSSGKQAAGKPVITVLAGADVQKVGKVGPQAVAV